jgi:hypothetical protein
MDTILVEALTEHGALTRRQLGSVLRERGVDAEGLRLGYVLMHAELELLICSGGMHGKQHTYALVEERIGRTPSPNPATRKDFARGGQASRRPRRADGSSCSAGNSRTEAGERTYWDAGSAPKPCAPLLRAHLLQGYDEYIVAYSESRDVLDIQELARLTPPGRTMYTHAIVLDGQVVGHWRRRLTATAMTIDVQLARRLDRGEQSALDDAVERYGRFVGLPVSTSRPA